MADTRARRRLVALAGVVLVGALVVLAARSADDATVTDVLPVPDVGSVRADRLANGTPVFVISTPAVGDNPPTLDVIQAFTPEIEGPVTGLVAWCSGSSQFVDPHHGVLYDNRGRRLPSSLAGRADPSVTFGDHTALDDLIHRQARLAEGRDAPEDPIVVEGIQPLQRWQVEERPFMEPALPPPSCRLPDLPLPAAEDDETGTEGTAVVSGDALRDELRGTRTVDHSFLATPLDTGTTGWQVTDGWLVVAPDGAARWCPDDPEAGCDGDLGPRPGPSFTFSAEQAGATGAAIGGPLAVRLDSRGQLARVAVMADTQWRGSSLRGTQTVSGALVASPTIQQPTIGLRDPVAAGDATCLSGAPTLAMTGTAGSGSVATMSVQVDRDTHVAVDTATTPLALSRLTLSDSPPHVDVELDAITCVALAVRTVDATDEDQHALDEGQRVPTDR